MSALPDRLDVTPKARGASTPLSRRASAAGSSSTGLSSTRSSSKLGGGLTNPHPNPLNLRADDFDGIQEVSDAEFVSSTRKRRSSPRASVRSSLIRSSGAPSSEIDHIDMSGQSSPPMTTRSPIRQPSSPTQASGRTTRRRRVMDSEDEDDDDDDVPLRKSTRTRTPRTRTRPQILSDDGGDSGHDEEGGSDDGVLVPPTAVVSKHARTSTTNGDRKGKGKPVYDDTAFVLSDEDEDFAGIGESATADDTTSYMDAEPEAEAEDADQDPDDEFDEYGDNDFNYSAVDVDLAFPGDGYRVPNFDHLPSTLPRRSLTPPIQISDSESDDGIAVIPSLQFLQSKKRKTAAAGDEMRFDDLKLIPELDHRWQQFYTLHWKRGADGSDEEDTVVSARGSSHRTFGVAAPAGEAKRASYRGRGRGGWGRGRGRGRGRK